MSKFIIYAPSYNENSGGNIALHRLCDLINKSKIDASCKIYPMHSYNLQSKTYIKLQPIIKKPILHIIRFITNKILISRFKKNSSFDTPLATDADIKKSIVIYPETIKNNPLGSEKIVRWLLYKDINFDIEHEKYNADLFFYQQDAFKPTTDKIKCGGELQVSYLLREIYKKTNFSDRSGSCYAIRKGFKKNKNYHPNESILIDNLSHQEISTIFNRSKLFISYDAYTLYSQYAAMCGCDSIVVPDPTQTKFEWQPEEGLRLGVAYGYDDLPWAQETKNMVLPYFLKQEDEINKSVTYFIKKCQDYFNQENIEENKR